MALLTNDIQSKLAALLRDEGLVSKSKLEVYAKRAEKEATPIVSLLLREGIVEDETMTHCIAYVSGVPYVNLADVPIDQNMLNFCRWKSPKGLWQYR